MTIQTQLHSPIKFNQLVSRKSNEQKKTDENVFDLLLAPRLCQPTGNALPCFTAMRTSSPTILDAYHSAFLQCVVKNNQRNAQHSNFYSIPLFFFLRTSGSNNVFWVVGDSSVNNVLITEHLSTNQHNGDRLRRIFPISPFDYSIEVTVNRTVPERVFSCVIDAATSHETTLFTYIVRTIGKSTSVFEN